MGSVTKEGVLIQGPNPLTGSWLGHLRSMAAVQGCLCILSSQMVLHVYDLKSQQSRKFSWGTSAVPGSGGVPACSGASLVPEPLGGFLCTYDWHHEALLRLWPRQGRAEALRLMLPVGASCAGRLKELPVLVFFGGQEVVLVATEGVQVARLRVSTGEIEDMMELSVKRLLLRCGEVFWELQLGSLQPTSASDFFHQLHQLRSLQLHPVTWTSSTSPPRAPLAPPSLREALGPWSASEAPLPELPELAELGRFGTLSTATSHVMAAPKTSFALLAVGLNLNLPSTPSPEQQAGGTCPAFGPADRRGGQHGAHPQNGALLAPCLPESHLHLLHSG
ncbi:unnamed protein product [Durusdinium trenchii]